MVEAAGRAADADAGTARVPAAGEPAGGAAPGGLKRFLPKLTAAPLRVRTFRYLVIGQGISEFGNAFQLVALPLLVFARGGTGAQIGLIASGFGVGRLLTTPVSGRLVDRLGAWRVMMVSDLGRLVLTIGLTVIAASGRGGPLLIGALAAPVGLFSGLFAPAELSVMPSVLPAEQLHAGNALNATISNLASLVGPGVAGLVVAVADPATAFGVDAATFALSAVSLLAIGRGTRPSATASKKPEATAAPKTFPELLRSSEILRNILMVTVIANLTMGGLARVALPALADRDLHTGAGGLGALIAAFAAGSLLGGLLAAGLPALKARGRTAMLSGLVLGGSVALTPVGGLPGAIVLLVLAGAAATVTNVLVITTIQRGTPPELLGRTMSALMFCGMGIFPFSVAVVGFLVDAYGGRSFFYVSGATLIAAFCFGLSRKAIRDSVA